MSELNTQIEHGKDVAGMIAAAMRHKGWMGTVVNIIVRETPEEIADVMFDFQNFSCLVRMGYENEPESKHCELKKIERFISLYEDDPGKIKLSDIEKFSYSLSAGSMCCLGIAQGDDEIEKLKEQYPDAMMME